MLDFEATLLAAAVGAIAAIAGTMIASFITAREARRDRAQEALEWMTGDTQRRNVGLAAIERSWGVPLEGSPERFARLRLVRAAEARRSRWWHQGFRRLVTPVLCGTAVYLLAAKNSAKDKEAEKREKTAAHELFNLDRVMTLLTLNPDIHDFGRSYGQVLWAINYNLGDNADGSHRNTPHAEHGLWASETRLRQWKEVLIANGVIASSAG
jgi:hypothetical protein